MNTKIKIALSILAIAFGAFAVVFGEFDDSPGAQGIGLILAIIGIVTIVKSRNRNV